MESLISGLGERPEALIFYFWGYALQSKEHGPTLLLDGPKLSSFTLARLRRLLADAADVSLVVLDTTLAEGSTGEPLDAVRAMGRALSHGDSTVSSLISARSPEQRVEQGPPPFTGLLQMILDAQTGSENALTPETLFRAMQSEEVMFADIPAAGCFLGQRDFEVVPPARPLSVRPPSIRPPSYRPPSFPPPSPGQRPPSVQPPGFPPPPGRGHPACDRRVCPRRACPFRAKGRPACNHRVCLPPACPSGPKAAQLATTGFALTGPARSGRERRRASCHRVCPTAALRPPSVPPAAPHYEEHEEQTAPRAAGSAACLLRRRRSGDQPRPASR